MRERNERKRTSAEKPERDEEGGRRGRRGERNRSCELAMACRRSEPGRAQLFLDPLTYASLFQPLTLRGLLSLLSRERSRSVRPGLLVPVVQSR